MAKFKVGDKVNCANYGNGVITKIITSVMPEIPYYVVFESGKELYLGADRLTLLVTREFIVIHRSGNVMTAEHRVNREIIKSAKATCAPSDTFDFDTGAKLAFDRLMGREEPKPEPKPAHRFKVGDRVVEKKVGYGDGEIVAILRGLYDVKFSDRRLYLPEDRLSPVPEPPKYYTGKVFCSAYKPDAAEAYEKLVGRVLSIVDGTTTWNEYAGGYKSFEDFCKRNSYGTWHEVKEPSDV